MIAQHISKWPPYCRHVEFRNDPKNNNTLSAMVPGHFHRVSAKLHWWNLRRSSFCVFQDGGHGGHLGFRTDLKNNNTWSASPKDHSWRVSAQSHWWNLRRSSKCQKFTDGGRRRTKHGDYRSSWPRSDDLITRNTRFKTEYVANNLTRKIGRNVHTVAWAHPPHYRSD